MMSIADPKQTLRRAPNSHDECFQRLVDTNNLQSTFSMHQTAKLCDWSQRSCRILCCLAFIAVSCLVFVLQRNDNTSEHLVVISTTYFTNSSSGYPQNTMVVLFNARKDIHRSIQLSCFSHNRSTVALTTGKLTPTHTTHGGCRWNAFIVTCPVVEHPTEFGLTETVNPSSTVKLAYRPTFQKRLDVVACYSPLFYAERWQPLVAAIEIYRMFGVSLQVLYIQSMLEEIVRFLEVYESHDFVKLEPWSGLDVGKETMRELGYDPNSEVEWRNQPAAHTDCILLFKEAAEFVIISDVDDILIPRLGRTYLEEFRRLSFDYPLSAGYVYPRHHADFVSDIEPHSYSLASLIYSIRIHDTNMNVIPRTDGMSRSYFLTAVGKSVVRPSRVQSSWLHRPGIVDEPYYMRHISEWDNFMIHLRVWREVTRKPEESPTLYRLQITDIINAGVIGRIGENFTSFILENARHEFDRLSSHNRYLPLIEECYRVSFYTPKEEPKACTTGPVTCDIPRLKGTNCAIARRQFKKERISSAMYVHHDASPAKLVVDNNGCTL